MPHVRFRPIAVISAELHYDSMKGKLSFAERVGRSYRRDPFFSMWGRGALALLMALCVLLVNVVSASVGLWSSLILTAAFLVWLLLVFRWSRLSFLRRAG